MYVFSLHNLSCGKYHLLQAVFFEVACRKVNYKDSFLPKKKISILKEVAACSSFSCNLTDQELSEIISVGSLARESLKLPTFLINAIYVFGRF